MRGNGKGAEENDSKMTLGWGWPGKATVFGALQRCTVMQGMDRQMPFPSHTSPEPTTLKLSVGEAGQTKVFLDPACD